MTAAEWIAVMVEGVIIAAAGMVFLTTISLLAVIIAGVIREKWRRIERWALHVFEFIVVSAIILEIVILF